MVVAGGIIYADDFNDRLPLIAYKTTDTSRSSTTTLASDPDLSLVVDANAVYLVDLAAGTNYDPTADFKFAFIGPTGATMTNWMYKARLPDSTETSGVVATLTTVTTFATASAALNQPLWIKGVLVTSSTSGTFAFQWAPNASVIPAAIVRAGSYLQLTRVA